MNNMSSKKKEKPLNNFFKKLISELRDTMTEPKNSIENFNKRFEQTKGKKINLKISYLKLSREERKKKFVKKAYINYG